jgi:hypothetical protein
MDINIDQSRNTDDIIQMGSALNYGDQRHLVLLGCVDSRTTAEGTQLALS